MKKAALVLLTLVSYSASAAETGRDGFQFYRAEFTRLQPNIRIIIHPSRRALQKAAQQAGARESNVAAAWSSFNPNDPARPCVIHIVEPATLYEPEWLGHEMMHCVYGRWHP